MDTFPINQSLLLIVLLFFTPASSSQEDNQRFRDCLPTLFDCGDVQVRYPFWTEEVIPCLAPSSNTSPDVSLFNYARGDLNLSFLYNCPHLPTQNHRYFKFPTSCSSDDLSDHAYYFTFEEPITAPFNNCHVIHVPILELNRDLLSEKEENPKKFWTAVLAEGIKVTWSLTHLEYLCLDCFKSNGDCGFHGPSTLPHDCDCNGTSHPLMCPPPPPPGNGKRKKYTIIDWTTKIDRFLSHALWEMG